MLFFILDEKLFNNKLELIEIKIENSKCCTSLEYSKES